MTIYERINQLNIEDILSLLQIKYRRIWNVLSLYENWKITWWWKADVNKWIVSDFSEKWRADWDCLDFVMKYLWISKWEAVTWFENNFWIKWDKSIEKKTSNVMLDKFNSLWELTDEQIKYLNERCIDFKSLGHNVIRNYDWRIAIPIKNIDGNIKSIQSRAISDTDQIRYKIEKNSDSDWIFYDWINKEDKRLIVVEWFTDFLSLRQFTTNVIGLVNAKNETQIDYVKFLSKTYEIYFIPDNDDAWKVTIEKFQEKKIKFNLFKLEHYWSKDINEVLVNYWIWEEILTIIYNESERPMSPLRRALMWAREYKRLFIENWWKLWFDSGYPLLDKYLWWIIKSKTYLIMAYSNQWKTRFAYSFIKNMIDKKKRMAFFSLEVDVWMLFLEIYWAIHWLTKEEVIENLDNIDISELEKYIDVFDEIRKLDEMENNVKNWLYDVVFVDFVQNIELWWDEYTKLTEIAIRLQKLAILSWASFFNLSQVNNESRFVDWSNMMPKWSWALFASSDVIFSLWGRDWNKYLTIAKNKYWPANKNFLLEPDYSRSKFLLAEENLEFTQSAGQFKRI